MEQTPAPTQTTSAATVNCGWCGKPMAADAVKCPACGKVTKAIYNQKIICYILCIVGGLMIGFSFGQLKNKRAEFNPYEYLGGTNGGSSDHTLGYILLFGGIIIGLVGIYYWWNIGKKLGTMMWW